MSDEPPEFTYIAPPNPMIGRRVEVFFRVEALLATGGMGAAYLARHEVFGVRCVIKLILPHLVSDGPSLERFKREAKAGALLEHDNIVQVQGGGVLEDTGQMYLRFAYIKGQPLDEYVAERGGRLSLHETVYLIFQLLDACDYMHAANVIHRDLKPSNIIVVVKPGKRVSPHINIIDFGIAKILDSDDQQTGSGMTVGTPTYMAPEQVDDAAGAGPLADIFAIGVIAYELLTGQLPWGRPDNPIALYHKQRTEPPATPPEDLVSAEVAEVLMRWISLRADLRPTAPECAIELACVVPATENNPNGTQLLMEIKPTWAETSPTNAQTLPNAIDVPRGRRRKLPAASPPLGHDGRLPPLKVVTVAPAAPPPSESEAVPSALPAEATTRERPRGGSGAATTPSSTPDSVTVHEAADSQRALVLPQTWAVLASMPTGLESRKFSAPTPLPATRERSIVAASELVPKPAGTPGPQPYAHAELPAVVVSITQLSRRTPEPTTPPPEPRPLQREPAPFVLLPGFAWARSRRKVVLGALGCALVVVASLAVVSFGSRSNQNEAADTRPLPRIDSGKFGRAPSVSTTDAARPAGQSQIIAVRSPGVHDTRASDAATPPPGIGSATVDASDSRAAVAAVGRHASDDRPPATPPANHRPLNVEPETSRRVATSLTPPASPIRAPGKSAVPDDAAKNRTGVIVVPRSQAWVKVWIDQVDAGTTPVRAEKVPVGVHKVLLVAESHRETVMVTVTAGRESVIERNW